MNPEERKERKCFGDVRNGVKEKREDGGGGEEKKRKTFLLPSTSLAWG